MAEIKNYTPAEFAELEYMIANAHVMDESELDEGVANIGSTVEVRRLETGKIVTYTLVGSFGADPLNGKISDESPIGAAIKGSRVGETVEFTAPNGNTFRLEILNVTR